MGAASQTGGQQTAPVLPPPPMTQPGPPQAGPPLPPVAPQHQSRPPRRRGPWLLVVAAVLVLIAAVAATAAITYAVARNTTAPTANPSHRPRHRRRNTPQPSKPRPKSASATCSTITTRKQGEGGLRLNGELNIPVMLRWVNSVVAVQNALNPATPADVSEAAKKYIDASLERLRRDRATLSVMKVNRLNQTGNTRTSRLPICADCLTDGGGSQTAAARHQTPSLRPGKRRNSWHRPGTRRSCWTCSLRLSPRLTTSCPAWECLAAQMFPHHKGSTRAPCSALACGRPNPRTICEARQRHSEALHRP